MTVTLEIVGLAIAFGSCLCASTGFYQRLSRVFRKLERPVVKGERLIRRMRELSDRHYIINLKFDQAVRQQGMEPNPEVEAWLRKAQEVQECMHSLAEIEEEVRCLNGCFPNYCWRFRWGKRIEENIREVRELLQAGRFLDDSFTYLPLERGKKLPITPIMLNRTTEKAIKDIMECLMNEDVGRIGIFGMGGVGKTTIMTHINNLLLEQRNYEFDNIFWVTVSRESTLVKLQNDIANAVNLNLSNDNNEMIRVAKLLEALLRRRRFLLILDDMWEAFPIEAVGIPNPTRENGCKLVITTRSLGVCRGMETQRNIEVNVLSTEEAWDLFRCKVGDEVLLSTDIAATARNVVRECDGLPIGIITVGLALRNVYEATSWYNVLADLRNSTGDIEGMEDRVFARLRYSYNRLRNDETRLCFLYGALYPENHQIEAEELIEYWIGEGLLGDEGTRGDFMLKGKKILNEMKDACMLKTVDVDGEVRYVKMHDLIRDMAIRITRMSYRCIIKAGVGLNKPPHESAWTEDVEKISLMSNDIKALVGQPRCPKLSFLLLQYNSISENISHSFFNHMENLKVVDLSYTGIKFLPESLCNLKNLRALLLRGCWNLRYLPSFAKLTSLRVLDLYCTPIERLPKGMENLVCLRRINLSSTRLQMFPTGLLSKCTLLEDLLMNKCLFVWQWKSFLKIYGGASLEELISSRHLAILQLPFRNIEALHRYAISGHSDQLESFRFCVGDFMESHAGKKSVVICGCDLLGGPVPVLLPMDTMELYILRCVNISKLNECFSNLMNLTKCEIIECQEMKYVMVASEDHLPNLERLLLHSLENLTGLCKGVHPPGTLAKLKFLEVDACPSLEKLFLRRQLQQFENLEEIKVSNCIAMKEIIAEDENEIGENGILAKLRFLKIDTCPCLERLFLHCEEFRNLEEVKVSNCIAMKEIVATTNSDIIISRLQRLELHDLWNLESICSGELVCDYLRTIDILKCEKLKRLPLFLKYAQQPKDLREIKGEESWWDSLEWADPYAKNLLQPFFKASDLDIGGFPSASARTSAAT